MKQKRLIPLALLAAGIAASWNVARSQLKTPEPAAAGSAPTEEVKSPLDTLDWMVGDWVDADENQTVEFSCRFTKNSAFLIRSFRVVNRKKVQMSGMQVIAWDPAEKTIRSWTYDSDGGFGEEIWKQSGNRYTIRAKHTLASGVTGSSLNTLTYVDENRCTWKSVNREIGGELQRDVDEFDIVRKPLSDETIGGK